MLYIDGLIAYTIKNQIKSSITINLSIKVTWVVVLKLTYMSRLDMSLSHL